VKLRAPKKQKRRASHGPTRLHTLKGEGSEAREGGPRLRICPRCGFQDPLCWRQNRWVSCVDYCRIEDFQAEYSHLADIRPGETVSDATCYYYRGKKQHLFVYRWPKVLGPGYYPRTRHLFERHVPRRPPLPGQKILAAAPSPEAQT
jgi:hypothetical protein